MPHAADGAVKLHDLSFLTGALGGGNACSRPQSFCSDYFWLGRAPDGVEFAARIISKKPAGPSSVLAVAIPPIRAPMTPSTAASAPVRYKLRMGVLGLSQVFRNLSGVAGYP